VSAPSEEAVPGPGHQRVHRSRRSAGRAARRRAPSRETAGHGRCEGPLGARVHVVATTRAMLPKVSDRTPAGPQSCGRRDCRAANRKELPASRRRTKSTHALQRLHSHRRRSPGLNTNRAEPCTITRPAETLPCDAHVGRASPESRRDGTPTVTGGPASGRFSP